MLSRWTRNRIYCSDFNFPLFPHAGWAIAARERDWKYRLSIYYAKAQDSGVYTCSTPRGLSNSIRVHVVGKLCGPRMLLVPSRVKVKLKESLVVDVQCPVLSPPEPPLTSKIEGARMGHGAIFDCPVGYRLEGAAAITCRYNGKDKRNVCRQLKRRNKE